MKTDERILDFLRDSGPTTVIRLSAALGLTKADIRYQLKNLILKDQVSVISSTLTLHGAGRPASSYQLKKKPPLDLMNSLINTLMDTYYSDLHKRKIAEIIARKIIGEETNEMTTVTWINSHIENLSNLGFTIRWQASSHGADIRVFEEPLSAIFADHALVEEILQQMVEIIKKAPVKTGA